MELRQLKVIVTGGARGMGAHFAARLSESGAQVFAGDVDDAGLETLPAGIGRARLDVTDEASIQSFVQSAARSMGGLNGLINNAGIIRDGLLVKKDRETGEIRTLGMEQWAAVLAVNLTGATMMVREFAKHLVDSDTKSGVIVNMSSISRHGNRGQSNYVASKAAIAANTVTWAREFAKFGIRVGAIAPGMIETPMTAGMNQKARDALVAAVPCGRIGDPEDIFKAVRFIVECDYFNGRCVDVDGGLTMT